MELALCYICWMSKWRSRSRYLADVPQDSSGAVCAECRQAIAVVRVEAAILEAPKKPTIQKTLDMIFDFTTYAKRDFYKFATCLFFTRSEGDRVEVYLDEIATAVYKAADENARLFGLGPVQPSALEPSNLIMLLISTCVVHEWLHHEQNLEERPVVYATEHVLHGLTDPEWPRELLRSRPMVWSHMVCPLKKGKQHPEAHVTFDECLLCMDHEKAPDCPVWELRWQLLGRRPIRPNTYHVTEITNPRRSYFDRIHDYSEMWDQVWDYFFGHAVHSHIQETFPRPYREIYVTVDFTREKEKITLVGGIDAYDPAQQDLGGLEFDKSSRAAQKEGSA
jgi:hypothetical protein